MQDDKTASLHATFSVDGEISDNDTRFLRVTIDVLNAGANYNGSYFSKKGNDMTNGNRHNNNPAGTIKEDNENPF